MALSNSITKLDTYNTYMQDLGAINSFKINKAFDCGLPGVWLYLKSIGLEDIYFDIQSKVKDKSIYFKELFYLLDLTNSSNNFFPKIPDELINIDISSELLAAQIELASAEFEIAYSFTHEELEELLQQICLPNKMVRIGDMHQALGIMLGNDQKYYIYKVGNTEALTFLTIDKCVDMILRLVVIENQRANLYINRSDIVGRPVSTAPSTYDLLDKYNKRANLPAKLKSLEFSVRAGLITQAKFWCDQCLPLDKSYSGPDLLVLAVINKNAEMIKLLLSYPTMDRGVAAGIANKTKDSKIINLFNANGADIKPFLPSKSPRKG